MYSLFRKFEIRDNKLHVKRANVNDEHDYIRGKSKNVKYHLTFDNKAQYYNVTKFLQRVVTQCRKSLKDFP